MEENSEKYRAQMIALERKQKVRQEAFNNKYKKCVFCTDTYIPKTDTICDVCKKPQPIDLK